LGEIQHWGFYPEFYTIDTKGEECKIYIQLVLTLRPKIMEFLASKSGLMNVKATFSSNELSTTNRNLRLSDPFLLLYFGVIVNRY